MAETTTTTTTSTAADVRAWASEQGLTTKATGRFSGDLLTAYNDAHPNAPYQR